MSLTPWGTQVVVEVSSAAPSAAIPTWADISDYAKPPISVQRGRQTDLPGLEPSTADLYLIDNDARFVVGNPTSPYNPWFKEGRRIRIKEILPTATPTIIPLIDGYISTVQSDVSMETLDGQTDRVTHVSVVDGLGRAQSAPAFISTLGAHIQGASSAAPSALVGFWPLLDSVAPFANLVNHGKAARIVTLRTKMGPEPVVSFAAADHLPGDDVSGLRLDAGSDGTSAVAGVYLQAGEGNDATNAVATLASGQVLTLCGWANLDATTETDMRLLSMLTDDGVIELRGFDSVASVGTFRLTKPAGTLTGSVNSTVQTPTARWTQVGMRLGFTPNLLELWVDDQIYSGTLTGALGGPLVINQVYMAGQGSNFTGSLVYGQLYVGADSAYTHADFVAQRDVALNGYDRQTTGQRVNLLADFAGIAADRRDVDPGVAVMLPAKLAGRRASDAWEVARQTEGGRLFFSGDGRLVFHDRRHVLNV